MSKEYDQDLTIKGTWRVSMDASRFSSENRDKISDHDLICEALDYELAEIMIRVPNNPPRITGSR